MSEETTLEVQIKEHIITENEGGSYITESLNHAGLVEYIAHLERRIDAMEDLLAV